MGRYSGASEATDIIWLMRFACWIAKATHTLSEYVMPIAFPQHQYLREQASMLRALQC